MYQKFTVVGRLGRDPELRYTPEGTPVCNFNVAVDRPASKEGEKVTDWFRVIAWRSQAEVCAQYLSKGKLVLVEGRLQIRQYQDSEGRDRTAVEVIASRVVFLSPKNGNNATAEAEIPEVNDEDVPF